MTLHPTMVPSMFLARSVYCFLQIHRELGAYTQPSLIINQHRMKQSLKQVSEDNIIMIDDNNMFVISQHPK